MIGSWAKGKALTIYESGQVGHKLNKPLFSGIAIGMLGKIRIALGLDR
jgi:hypothetical protein